MLLTVLHGIANLLVQIICSGRDLWYVYLRTLPSWGFLISEKRNKALHERGKFRRIGHWCSIVLVLERVLHSVIVTLTSGVQSNNETYYASRMARTTRAFPSQ